MLKPPSSSTCSWAWLLVRRTAADAAYATRVTSVKGGCKVVADTCCGTCRGPSKAIILGNERTVLRVDGR